MKAGWEVKPLGEVATIQNGGTPKSKVAEFWGGDVEWLTPKDMGKLETETVASTPRKITELGLAKCSAKLVPANSVILSTRAPIGHLAMNSVPMAFNQGCRGLIPGNHLHQKYLFYFLAANVPLLNDLGTGTTFKELSAGALKGVPIPLPPLEEQKRIVAVLDGAFEGLDRARTHIQTNLQNARELFEAQVNGLYQAAQSAYGASPLGNLTERITKGSSPKWQGVDYVETPGVLFVTSENVGTNTLLLTKRKYVDEMFNTKDKKSILTRGDVLTNIVGASIGRTAVFDHDEVANINQAVCLIRCEPDRLNNNYLCYLLNSPFFKKMLHAAEVDNARANLSLTFFRNFEVPLPALNIQSEIVSKVDGLRDQTEKLEAHYTTKLADLDELRQSLLKKAFAGELT